MRTFLAPLLIMFFLANNAIAQPRWSVDHTVRFINGPSVGSGALHHFIQAHNHVGDTLYMRWRKKVVGPPPAIWRPNFADTEQNTPDIRGIDSLDFVFPDSTFWVTNKFVIGVNPLGATGYAEYIFTIFELGHEADSIRLFYYVNVHAPLGVDEYNAPAKYYPNPASNRLYGFSKTAENEQVTLIAPGGKEMTVNLIADATGFYIDISKFSAGVYFLLQKEGRDQHIHKIIIE